MIRTVVTPKNMYVQVMREQADRIEQGKVPFGVQEPVDQIAPDPYRASIYRSFADAVAAAPGATTADVHRLAEEKVGRLQDGLRTRDRLATLAGGLAAVCSLGAGVAGALASPIVFVATKAGTFHVLSASTFGKLGLECDHLNLTQKSSTGDGGVRYGEIAIVNEVQRRLESQTPPNGP